MSTEAEPVLIFGGVDGSGLWNNDKYAKDFEHSHVNVLYKSWSYGPRRYERGPDMTDTKPADSTIWTDSDMNKWRTIYDHPKNRETIGPDYNLIKPGQRLVIP
jgi:hypothetical protein